jgi:hypothetical protein
VTFIPRRQGIEPAAWPSPCGVSPPHPAGAGHRSSRPCVSISPATLRSPSSFSWGADILSTAVAPSWDQIGKLGAIAVIRTTLNFFLMRELREAGQMQAGEAFG